jgi:DnaJ-class molecular chaperone
MSCPGNPGVSGYSGKRRDIIKDGFFTCDNCYGSGKGYSGYQNGSSISKNIVTCDHCNGTGRRKPTWTEYIMNKNQLEDCEYNKNI